MTNIDQELASFFERLGIRYEDHGERSRGTMTIAFTAGDDFGLHPALDYMVDAEDSDEKEIILQTLELLSPKYLRTTPFKSFSLWGRASRPEFYEEYGCFIEQTRDVNISYKARGIPHLGLVWLMLHEIGHSTERDFNRIFGNRRFLPDNYYTLRAACLPRDLHDTHNTDLLPFLALFPDEFYNAFLETIPEDVRPEIERFRKTVVPDSTDRTEKLKNLVDTIRIAEERIGHIAKAKWNQPFTSEYARALENYGRLIQNAKLKEVWLF